MSHTYMLAMMQDMAQWGRRIDRMYRRSAERHGHPYRMQGMQWARCVGARRLAGGYPCGDLNGSNWFADVVGRPTATRQETT